MATLKAFVRDASDRSFRAFCFDANPQIAAHASRGSDLHPMNEERPGGRRNFKVRW